MANYSISYILNIKSTCIFYIKRINDNAKGQNVNNRSV